MATLLLAKNRLLRAGALLASLALLVVYSNSTNTSAAGAATGLRLRVANRCDRGFYTLKIGAVTAFSNVGSTSGVCGCPSSVTDVSTTDATVLAAINAAPGCTDFSLSNNSASFGGNYVQWARVDITRGATSDFACLGADPTGGCAAAAVPNCNYTFYSNSQTLNSPAPPDTDGDGTNDCTDPDLDNDGVLNAADNCPLNANPDQADADGNGVGDVCQGVLAAVPWLGSELLPHQVYSGGQIVLQASFLKPADGSAMPLASGTWDPGDGTGPTTINVSNSLNLELAHTYTGSAGQPFTATISVNDGVATYTDTFKVVIAPNSRETKVNMAIDKGLWNLHKTLVRTVVETVPAGYWQGSGFNLAATSSSVQAFEINNHREGGDVTRDPYVKDVARGLAFITGSSSIQKLTTFGLQNGNNPDSNGNGFGLWVNNNDHSSYIGGQVIDAMVASGTPDKLAVTGIVGVKGRSYKDIVTDLLDGYSWGIADDTGGFLYGMQDTTGQNDTSATHWWSIGVLASHTWGLDAPAWVKNISLNTGVPLLQAFTDAASCHHTAVGTNDDASDGHFGYNNTDGSGRLHWEWDGGTNTTAAGLVILNADGVAQTNARFQCASQYLNDRYTSSMGNFYTMYQVTKAMRTALNATGVTTPIANLNGSTDWYAGYADYLVTNQNAAGAFTSVGQTGVNQDLSSSWAIIILSPSLFELPPSAACSASPATIGKNGGTVNFSAAASFHPDSTATITGYSWNFDDGSAAGSGVTTSHPYAVPGSFPTTRNATVTVTDNRGNSSTASCPVTIVNNNVPPSVTIAGPYTVCKGSALTLTGTAADEDGTISATAWDLNEPTNFATIDATGLSVDATATFASKAPGNYSIGFRATDDNGASSSIFSSVTVLAANDPSCNQPPTITMPPNQILEATSPAGASTTFAATATDDHDTITPVCTPASGSTFGINATTSKTTAVSCTATDTQGLSASGSFNVTVQDTTPPAITVPAPISVHSATAGGAAVNYSATATDIVDVTAPVLCDRASGSNFNLGTTTVNCSSTDQHGNTSHASFTIEVTNAAPTAAPANAQTHGAPVTVNLSGNWSDADGDTITGPTPKIGPFNGTIVVNPDGSVTYTPFNTFHNGNDTWTYSINDGHGGSSDGTLTINVHNIAPLAGNDSATTHGQVTINVLANDSDADGDALTLQIMQGAQHGSLVINGDKTITYTPFLPLSFPNDTFTYSVDDGHGGTATATVSITITNALPVANNDTVTLAHNQTVITIPVLTNDTDADGDTVTVGQVSGNGNTHGTFTSNANSITYSAAPGFFGPTASLTYSVNDGHGGVSNTATVTINFTETPPVAINDSVTTHGAVNINLLSNDSDADGDPLTVQILSNAHNGSTQVNADQSVTYTPFANNPATSDSFTYSINDGHGGTATATVSITITNAAPVAVDDTVTLAHNQSVITIPVLANDTDADHDPLAVGGPTGSPATHGTLVLNPDNTITYTAAPGYFGPTATFTYSAKDGRGGFSNVATVTINFTNTPPTTSPYFVNTHGEPVTVGLLANAQDADGDTVTVVSACGGFNNPAVGFCGSSNGSLTFTPNPNWRGPQIQLGYTVSDGHGGNASSFVRVTYVNAVPQVVPHEFTTVANTPITLTEGDLLVGDTDADGDHLFVPSGVTISHGTIAPIPSGDGGTFTPDLNFVGDAIITFVVDDGHGGQVNDTAVIHVVPAPSVTTISCPASVVYDGTPQTVCTAHVTGNGNLDQDVAVTYAANTAVGTATASAVFPGDAAHVTSNASTTFQITKAPTATVVSCTPSVVFNGAAQEVCTANVTGAGGLNQPVTPVTYSDNTNVGTAGATATYAGDDNHAASTGNATFAITKAPSTTVVSCTASVVYNGAAQEVCTASVTGAGGLDQGVTPVTYTSNTDVGTASATATYAGDDNHASSTGNATFAITKAPTTTVVTCPTSLVYTGSALTPCTANVTGAAGLNQGVTPVTYTSNTNVGTAGATATYAGDANYAASTGNASFAITQAPTSTAINAPTITVAANGTVTVTVTSGSGTVLGNVSLSVDGGAAVTQALSGGASVFTVASPNAGDHALVATYAAQDNFSASSGTGNLHVNPSPTATVLATSATPQLAGTAVTFTATVAATSPGSGTPNGVVTFKEGATVLGTGTLNAAGVATFTTATLSNGPHTITAVYNGVNNYLTSTSNNVSKLIFGLAAGGGTFVIGDNNAILNASVNFWGSQWEKNNSLTGGSSNASFKGFASGPAVPGVGQMFTAAPGNSAPPPAGVPQYIGIIVTSKVTKSGSTISGTIVKMVVVQVNAGYAGDPGHAGTGTIVAFVQ